jgi:3-hydroxybutyryl-CoA dehydrogenase
MVTDNARIGIVGAGRMGRGMAVAFSYGGHPVTLIDLKQRDGDGCEALVQAARAEILADLRFLAGVGALADDEIEKVAARTRIAHRPEAGEVIAASDVIFEAVPETIAAKTECFDIVNSHARPECPIASTTSTISADILGALVAGPERFCNAHWLNPAYLMPLVELSPCESSAPETIQTMRALLTRIGKVPIVCKSSPGYIVPRIQALAMNEAARLVEEGVASVEDIDTAIRVGFGLRFSVLGLLEFIDWGGGDILFQASRFLAQTLDPVRFAPAAIVAENMAANRRGLRDGMGFYDFRGIDSVAYRNERLTDFVSLLKNRNLMPKRG